MHPSRPTLQPTQSPILLVPSHSRGLSDRGGGGVNHATPSNADVEETVELFFNSLSGPLWPALRRTLPLHFPSNSVIYRS
jgi:hypothetical protein